MVIDFNYLGHSFEHYKFQQQLEASTYASDYKCNKCGVIIECSNHIKWQYIMLLSYTARGTELKLSCEEFIIKSIIE